MKDQFLAVVAAEPRMEARRNRGREYLQACVLRSLQDSGAFASYAFQGGTALRFLHGLRRFSEDLDFARERPEHDPGFDACIDAVTRDLTDSGYEVESTIKTARTVHAAFLKFHGLLHEIEPGMPAGAKLSIRVEVDTDPPVGAKLETRLVTRYFPLALRVHDLSSCMAGKIHALLARGHTKGRDLFDLAWYLTHPERPAPNFTLLAGAFRQTGGSAPGPDTWREVLADFVEGLDWPAVVRDVSPFLEDAGDLRLMDRELLLGELRRR